MSFNNFSENPNDPNLDATQLDYDPSKPLGTDAGEDISNRMERYRNERNKFRSRVKELKHSLLKKDENFRDALKKAEVLKNILDEQELEIESLREYIQEKDK